MKVRDLKPNDTFHHVGGNRKYRYYGDHKDDSNDTFVSCVLSTVPYVIDLDVEVDRINEEEMYSERDT